MNEHLGLDYSKLPKPYYEEPGIVIFHGDCREMLPLLPKVDLVLTDPPYGIGADKGRHREQRDSRFYRYAHRREYADSWDIRPSDEVIDLLPSVGATAIIWGGNYFAHVLQPSKSWLVWDKCNTMPSFSDCELAWTNIKRNHTKMFTYSANGLLAEEKERWHPTQKPVALMIWCIEKGGQSGSILDPFMGSGTTLRAAKDLGRSCIGIEIEERYVEIAVKRLQQEVLPLSFGGNNGE